MPRVNKKLEWNVIYFDINKKAFTVYNVLSDRIIKEIVDRTKKITNRDLFAEEVRHIIMYYFWSKCEWEIVLQEWTGASKKEEIKVDVYDQLTLNWNRFIDYLWNNLYLK